MLHCTANVCKKLVLTHGGLCTVNDMFTKAKHTNRVHEGSASSTTPHSAESGAKGSASVNDVSCFISIDVPWLNRLAV